MLNAATDINLWRSERYPVIATSTSAQITEVKSSDTLAFVDVARQYRDMPIYAALRVINVNVARVGLGPVAAAALSLLGFAPTPETNARLVPPLRLLVNEVSSNRVPFVVVDGHVAEIDVGAAPEPMLMRGHTRGAASHKSFPDLDWSL